MNVPFILRKYCNWGRTQLLNEQMGLFTQQVGSWLTRVLGAVEIWGEDLSVHATWVARIQDYVEQIQGQGANETLAQVLASTCT